MPRGRRCQGRSRGLIGPLEEGRASPPGAGALSSPCAPGVRTGAGLRRFAPGRRAGALEGSRRYGRDGTHHGTTAAPEGTRRDFLTLTTTAFAAVGVGALAWPFIHQMNPSADVLALASIEVDLSPIAEGQAITVMWRGKPVFVRHRTAAEIQAARETPLSALKDPEPDERRVQRPQWLVMIGVCTHLGCVPLGQKPTDNKGNYNGLVLPLPRQPLRHLGADPPRAGTLQPARPALHLRLRQPHPHRLSAAEPPRHGSDRWPSACTTAPSRTR